MTELQRLRSASSVVIIRGADFNAKKRTDNERLAVEKDLDEIGELAEMLCDVVPGSESAWMEWPALSFAFVSDKDVLGEVGLLGGGRWVRHSDADLELRDPVAVMTWLRGRGVELH